MDNINKELTIALKARIEQDIAKCKDCGGGGSVAGQVHSTIGLVDCNLPTCTNLTSAKSKCTGCSSCPSCADLRKMAGELCWHEWDGVSIKEHPDYWWFKILPCKKCGFEHAFPQDYIYEYERFKKGLTYFEHEYYDPFNKRREFRPTYTIQSLRQILERMGEWEGFVWHVRSQIVTATTACLSKLIGWSGKSIENHITFDRWGELESVLADILTSDTLMAQAVLKYLKEVSND